MSAPATLGWYVLAPLMGSIAAFLFGRRRATSIAIVVLTAMALAWATTTAVAALLRFGSLRYRVGAWGAPLGIELRLDGLSIVFLVTTLIVVLAASVTATTAGILVFIVTLPGSVGFLRFSLSIAEPTLPDGARAKVYALAIERGRVGCRAGPAGLSVPPGYLGTMSTFSPVNPTLTPVAS